MMRLARFLAQAGVASRRKSEDIIRGRHVAVNGRIVTIVGTNVDPANDSISVDGKRVSPESFVYYLVHKPVGYVCSAKQQGTDKLIIDLVPKQPRVYPVGRLDKDSSGLVLLTNDGDLAMKLMHPRYGAEKKYEVTLVNSIPRASIERLLRGVRLREGIARADAVERLSGKKLHIVVHQGWHRQIRRMLGRLGHDIESLVRISEAGMTLSAMKPGEYRTIARNEITI